MKKYEVPMMKPHKLRLGRMLQTVSGTSDSQTKSTDYKLKVYDANEYSDY